MLEEFRRRKNLKDFFELNKNRVKLEHEQAGMPENTYQDMDQDAMGKELQFAGSGPERYFEAKKNEVFDPSDFTLIFIDSDSVTSPSSFW